MGQKFLNEIGRFKEPHLFAQRRSLSLESTLTKSKKEVFLEKFNDKKKAKNRLSKYLKNMPIFLSKYEGYIPKK